MTNLIHNKARFDGIKSSNPVRKVVFIVGLLLFAYPWLLYAEKPNLALETGDVSAYLERAEHALSLDRLTTPSDDNALLYIEQALSFAPNNPQASGLLQRIVKRYGQLIDQHLNRGGLFRQHHVQLARTYRERAHEVIAKYGLDGAELRRIDRLIAQHDPQLPADDEVQIATDASPAQIVDKLVVGHAMLGESALASGDLEAAEWHAAEAGAIERRYIRSSDRLQSLHRSIAAKKQEQGVATRAYTGPHAGTATTLVREIIACRIELGEHALEHGNVHEAQRQAQVAEGFASYYGVEENSLKQFSERVARTSLGFDGWRKNKLFGTF